MLELLGSMTEEQFGLGLWDKRRFRPDKPDGEPEEASSGVAANCCLHWDKPGWKAFHQELHSPESATRCRRRLGQFFDCFHMFDADELLIETAVEIR